MILQGTKQRYEEKKKYLNKMRKRFLHNTHSVSAHECKLLHDHYSKQLRMIRGKICVLICQQSAKTTVIEPKQPPAARPLTQGCAHSSLEADLSDKKVRLGMCSDIIASSVISCVLCASSCIAVGGKSCASGLYIVQPLIVVLACMHTLIYIVS